MFKSIRSIFQSPSKLQHVADVLYSTIELTASAHAKHEDRITKLEEDFAEAKGLNQSRFEKRPTKADLLTVEMQQQDQIDALKVQVAELNQTAQTQNDYNQRNYTDAMNHHDALNRALDRIDALEAKLANILGDLPLATTSGSIITVNPKLEAKVLAMLEANDAPKAKKPRKKAATKATVTDKNGTEAVIEKVED